MPFLCNLDERHSSTRFLPFYLWSRPISFSRRTSKNPNSILVLRCGENRSWVGRVYPEDIKQKDFLKAYSRKFPSVELNSTFYGVPSEQTVLKWKEESDEGFIFCPKFSETITHRPFDNQTPLRVSHFCKTMGLLQEKLGMSFLQFPENFSPASIGDLERILDCIPPGYRAAVELRHPDWFWKNDLTPAAAKVLEKRNLTAVITDTTGRRDVLHQRLTSDATFIRFTGNNLHKTDLDRVDEWIERIQEWSLRGTQRDLLLCS